MRFYVTILPDTQNTTFFVVNYCCNFVFGGHFAK
jgi:hypothetical protein